MSNLLLWIARGSGVGPGAARRRVSARRLAGVLGGALLVSACATGAAGLRGGPPIPSPWVSSLRAEHPLVGRIWSSRRGRFVSSSVLARAVRGARFVVVGERHDSPDHHRLEGWLVTAALAGGRRASVGMEMLDDDRQAALDQLAAGGGRSPEAFARAVRWADTGWPAFALYRPVVEAALEAGARIVATHPVKAVRARVARQDLETLGAAELRRLRLLPRLGGAARAGLEQEIAASHCGYANEAMVRAMVAVQELKDAWMAARLVERAGPQGALLVAGAGHARRDRGVPRFLARQLGARGSGCGRAAILSVGLVEVEAGAEDVPSYEPERFDFLWFTPRVDEVDPCAKFRESLERMRRRGQARPPGSDVSPTPSP